jgi:cytochrome c-type biogenesis protein CcmF
MIPELGNFALILALGFGLLQILALHPIRIASVIGQFIFLSISLLCLIISFINNDMTVIYVIEHSHQSLPFIYRVGAAWGGHEGSLLLWCVFLSGWTLLLVIFVNPTLSKNTLSKIIMILGIISSGFILFLFSTSNPFIRYFPDTPITGNDLTPVLQDPGLIFHPPMLYLGYVGFAIGFAFAITALIEGNLDKSWTQALKPWIILPWGFLSCGIVLGSWWAYRELGWGGWWFWDPVENASLLPWLSATALIHSLIVSEKRDVFKAWTLLLAIVTFAFCLIGTFLVRSGVLVSVHAFANDPSRGIFLLAYLTFIVGSAFVLYAFRMKYFYQPHQFHAVSRETGLLINTVFLLTAAATIMIGTLYPILLDALNSETISVGEPYFNTVFLPIMLPLLLLMGFAPHVNWGQQSLVLLWKKTRNIFLISLILGMTLPLLFGFKFHLLASLGVFASLWIIISTCQYVLNLQKISFRHAAMMIAHIGIAIIVLGIAINKSYSEERQVKILPGETTTLAGYQFTFDKLQKQLGSNYTAMTAIFSVNKDHGKIKTVAASQRIYTHDQTLSKTGILVAWWGDLYVTLGSPLSDGSWSVRLYYKPLIRFIWLGGFMLLLGGLLLLL